MRHSPLRLIRRFAGFLAAIVFAGVAGYRVHDYRENSLVRTEAVASWDLDYFVQADSFSEVEATRAELEGLAYRYRTEARTRLITVPNATLPVAQRRFTVISELERAMTEFRDGPGESYIAQDLLLLLKRTGNHDRWLDVYLDLLYRRPTEEVVGLLAREARELGSATGRTAEVELALRHVLEIPLDFPAKNQLRTPAIHVTSLPRTRGSETAL